LEVEKRSAAQIGKDITKYVDKMSDLESRVRVSEPKVSELAGDLAKKLELCRKLQGPILQNFISADNFSYKFSRSNFGKICTQKQQI
jgi:hypothetical protein